jgi:hypothetical protein
MKPLYPFCEQRDSTGLLLGSHQQRLGSTHKTGARGHMGHLDL